MDFHDDFHGSDGPIIARRHKLEDLLTDQIAFYNACLDAGFPANPDHNHPDATGVGPYALNNPNGIRWSTALGYINPDAPSSQPHHPPQLRRPAHPLRRRRAGRKNAP